MIPLPARHLLTAVLLTATVHATGCGRHQVPPGLEVGRQYYVYVDYLEVQPSRPGGEPWDVDSSGPDVAYTISWQGNDVFESPKRSDTLVAEWKAREMGMGLGSESLIKGESSTLAARITARPGTLTLTVRDVDLVDGDDIATLEVPIGDLVEGRNEFTGVDAISRIVILAQPIPPIEER